MVDTNKIDWVKINENVSHKDLIKEDVEIKMIKLDPNTKFAEHTHEKNEWVYILKGSYTDHNGTYTKGHFINNKKGSIHSVQTGEEGCEVLMILSKD